MGMDETEFVEQFSDWGDLGYNEAVLHYNGKASKYKGIFFNNTLVTVQSTKYKLFPNEKAIEVSERIATLLGGRILYNHYTTPHWIKGISGNWGTQVHSLICFDETIGNIGNVEIKHGLSVYNSIDGTLKFGMRSFMTFGSLFGSPISIVFLPHRRDLSIYVGKHMKSLETGVKKLQIIGQTLLESDDGLIDILETLTKYNANKEHMEILEKKLPAKFFKNVIWNGFSLFNVYQNLCNKIWYNYKTEITAKLLQFDRLHSEMFNIAFIAKLADG